MLHPCGLLLSRGGDRARSPGGAAAVMIHYVPIFTAYRNMNGIPRHVAIP
ncbi:hypothetical protein B8V81_1425 [Paenibacillus pasadenensis]|uniref:Uncharacterized protein n=1 Tax=Paenibacillus pasadenensis TaxID=217090 RepID=A0A2N5NA15_9BACL|nr:hypothetical protein B8V81_1425 [Paenibacillus pasadenensis]